MVKTEKALVSEKLHGAEAPTFFLHPKKSAWDCPIINKPLYIKRLRLGGGEELFQELTLFSLIFLHVLNMCFWKDIRI